MSIIKNKDKTYKSSLCWDCKNALPNKEGTQGCNWSINFLPVNGWEAKKHIKTQPNGFETVSYFVIDCPEFEKG